jgi:hypothetical protein
MTDCELFLMIHFYKSRQKIERIALFHKNDRQWQCYIVLYMCVCCTKVENKIQQERIEEKRTGFSRGPSEL